MNKRVKIVATLGPAVEFRGGKKFGESGYWGESLDVEASAEKIAQLIKEGANVFRFNFSHGDHAEQGARMATVRKAEEIAGQKVGFLLDTKGPEIRTELLKMVQISIHIQQVQNYVLLLSKVSNQLQK